MTIFQIERKFRREHRFANIGPRLRYKGSSGSNTTTTQSGPPAQVLQNYEDVYNQAQSVANQPQQQYSGAVLAGFTPMQEAGFNDVNTAANAGQPFINQASQDETNAATMLDPANFGGTVAQYQSPYTQQVVNATEGQLNNQNAIQQNQLAGNAASAGAFGGDRQAVAQSVLAGQQQANEAPTIANLYNTGFTNATNAAQSGAWLQNAAGSGMANLGQEAQSQGLTAANAELTAGSQQQQQEQAELNVPYQAFLAAQGYPYQETNWLEGMATGTGSASGGQGSTTSPSPSGLSQAAGLGTAVVGGLGATGAFGSNGYLSNAFGSGGASAASSYAGDAALNAQYLGGAAAVEDIARGGRVPRRAGGQIAGFAPGGTIPGDVAVNVNGIPQSGGGMGQSNGLLGGSSNLLGGGGNLLDTSTGTTSTTSGPGGDSTIGSIIKDAGIIAANVYGGPAGGMAASYLSNQYHFKRGGGLEDFIRKRLPQVPVRPRGFDTGGDVGGGAMTTPAGLSASVGGNPMLTQLLQNYTKMPTAQLQNEVQRLKTAGASMPGGQVQAQAAQRALQMRNSYPGSGGGQPAVPGAPAPTTPQAGMSPMGQPAQQPQGGMQSMYARGGETEDDDDTLPDLEIPLPGPSVPGGLMAGFGPVPAEAALAPVSAGAMGSSGHIPAGKVGSYVPPPATLAPIVQAAAEKYGLDPKPFAWQLSQESHWNPNAYNPSSDVAGIGQFKKATAAEMGITDRTDPEQSIMGAAKYMRQLLDKSGGDYERAIGHYGTFSTGHGKDADDAVRAKFRDFMTTSAKRGGAIPGFAPGGDVGDGSVWDPNWGALAQGDLGTMIVKPDPQSDVAALQPEGGPTAGFGPAPSNGITSDAAQPGRKDLPTLSSDAAIRAAPGKGPPAPPSVTDGGGGSIPIPPIPPPDSGAADTPNAGTKTAGFGPQPDDTDRPTTKADPWESVLTAGLGMMAGTSPFAGVNIGAGGLKGVQNYQQQKQLAIQDQLRADQAKTNAVWRAGQLGNAQDRTKALELAANERNQPHYSYTAVTQPDPDNPDKTISGMMRTDASGKTDPTFIRTDTNPNKSPTTGMPTNPDDRHKLAVAIAGYQQPSLSSFAISKPEGQAIMSEVMSVNPDYQASRYPEVSRAMTAFGSGKQGDTIRSLNVATQHLSTMDEAAAALKNGDTRLFNAIGNRINQELGVPAPTTFDGLKQIVGTEIEKAVAGGIGSEADRSRLMQALNGANSPAQLSAISKSFKDLMAGQAAGLKRQYEDATGFKTGSPFGFETKLSPETQKAIGLSSGQPRQPSSGVTPPQSTATAIPMQAIQMLKSKPETAAQFDSIFGPGTSSRYIAGP